MMKKWFVLGLALLLLGCGSVPKAPLAEQDSVLNAKQLCCEDFRSIAYEPLPQKVPTKAVLDSSAPARQFPQGRSYFRAFSLIPADSQGLWIKSYFNGPFIGQFLQPVILFLDANHAVLGGAAPQTDFRQGNIFGDSEARMEGGVKVPSNAKYLIVFTAPFVDTPKPASTAPSTAVLPLGTSFAVTTNPGYTFDLERSKIGKLSLNLQVLPQ